jgi:nucleotide-binding universal stress UspA family protein
MKQNILVPFDGSDNSVEALRVAIDLVKLYREKIILINVQPSYKTLHTKMFFSLKQIEDFKNQVAIETMLPGEEMLKNSKVEYSIKVRTGDAREEICREARADTEKEEGGPCKLLGVRFIVMGSRGLNPLMASMMGSVSMGVLHHAPCPVIVVPYSC